MKFIKIIGDMMRFTFDELVEITNAQIVYKAGNSGTFSISTDSRDIEAGQVYLPLIGENFDGHDFIEDALENGVNGYFTADKSRNFSGAKFVLYVKDTREAYLKLAQAYKQKVEPITIAITGSVGKTTTKEMLYCIAKQLYKTHKSEANFNNEIGFCQTISKMPNDTEVLIVELGMRASGEIALIAGYAKPDIAIITNIGNSHIGRLKSLKNIAKAKCEITEYIHEEGCLIADNNELIKKYNKFINKNNIIFVDKNAQTLKILTQAQGKSEFEYKGFLYTLNIEGEHLIQDAMFAIEAGLKLGICPEKIAAGLNEFRPLEKRWEIQKIKGFKIINDSYNASPESMKATIKTFVSIYKAPLVLVLGDMAELGEDEKKYHKEIGDFLNTLNNYKYNMLITVGKLAKNISDSVDVAAVNFETNKDCAKYLLKNAPKGATILLKASRSMKFEQIIEELLK